MWARISRWKKWTMDFTDSTDGKVFIRVLRANRGQGFAVPDLKWKMAALGRTPTSVFQKSFSKCPLNLGLRLFRVK